MFTIDMQVDAGALGVVHALENALETEGRLVVQGWHVPDAKGRWWEIETADEGGAVVRSPELTSGEEEVLGAIVGALRQVGRVHGVEINLKFDDTIGPELAQLARRVQEAFA